MRTLPSSVRQAVLLGSGGRTAVPHTRPSPGAEPRPCGVWGVGVLLSIGGRGLEPRGHVSAGTAAVTAVMLSAAMPAVCLSPSPALIPALRLTPWGKALLHWGEREGTQESQGRL